MIDDTPHETTTLFHRHLGPVEIDNDIFELIRLLWATGHDTFFCCQGDEDHECDGEAHADPYCWSAKPGRAYILMPRTPANIFLTLRIMTEFLVFDDGDRVLWDISFDNEVEDQGPRICWRFPKPDIPLLMAFVEERYTYQQH